MATLNRATFEQITASPEFRRVKGDGTVLAVFRRVDVRQAMIETFSNLQGVNAQGRPKYEKFLRTIERAYAGELDTKIRSYGP